MENIRMTVDEWVDLHKSHSDLMQRLDRMVTAASAYRTYVNHLEDTGQLTPEQEGELGTKESLYGDDIDREFELQTLRDAEMEDEDEDE